MVSANQKRFCGCDLMITEASTDQIKPEEVTYIDQGSDREVVIRVRNVGKMYRIYNKPADRLKQMLFWRFGKSYGHEFWAVRNVSFEIRKGETVGIIGRNGSGKSTLLQMIAGTLAPSEGEVEVCGRVAALLELGSGFNPEFTGRENVFLNGAILGISREEMERRFDEIAAFADIGEFIDQPVKTYSSGMVVRLAFAVQAFVEPDILIVDEALAVGDVAFQARCLEQIRLLQQRGTTTLFVTHDSGTFQNLCDHGYLLDHGNMFAHGRPAQVSLQYYELVREAEHARQRIHASTEAQVEQVLSELEQREQEISGKTAEGEYRFGTQAARIIAYRILNNEGQETASLLVGEPFQVCVTIECAQQIDNLSLGVMLRNPQGQNLMGMHSYHEHRVQFGIQQPGTRIEIVCQQEMLLNPGDYLLNLGIADCRSDYDFTSLDSRNNIAKLTVVGKAISYGLIHTQPIFRWADACYNYDIEQVRELYQQELANPDLHDILKTILSHDQAPPEDASSYEKEERAWPGEPRFRKNNYYQMMLGRYLFAASRYCRGARVLEACSGLGWGAYLVAHYAKQVVAFDVEQQSIRESQALWPATNIEWLTSDVRDLSFLPPPLFDVALAMEAIEHLTYSDGELMLRNLASQLGAGGLCIGTSAFPDTEAEAEAIRSTNPFHLHIFTASQLSAILKRYFSHHTIIGGWMFIAVK
jgi:ABC-type polysaccharide/polyol phosphate transport system ATPase subunit/2-polyprenyl-3-methyl-5-hydroxy-6-metoxy-1,4-benzoquinol methylase